MDCLTCKVTKVDTKLWKVRFTTLLYNILVKIHYFNNFLRVCWFLGKNLSNFVSPIWKLHNPYCHTYAHQKLMPQIFRPSCCHAVLRPFFLGCKIGGRCQNLAGCGNFSRACSFYCTAFSFYCTADARSDSENLQKFLKKWLFLDIFCSYYFKTNLFIFTIQIFCSLWRMS